MGRQLGQHRSGNRLQDGWQGQDSHPPCCRCSSAWWYWTENSWVCGYPRPGINTGKPLSDSQGTTRLPGCKVRQPERTSSSDTDSNVSTLLPSTASSVLLEMVHSPQPPRDQGFQEGAEVRGSEEGQTTLLENPPAISCSPGASGTCC